MSVFVGIDVGARSVDVSVQEGSRKQALGLFPQTAEGHAKVIKELCRLSPERVVLEATGIYYLDLALALHKAQLPVSVINPRSFKHFAQLKLQNNKTDPLDSSLLAEYGARIEPRLWVPPSQIHLGLRDLGRQINRLVHTRTQAKNRLHALMSKVGTLEFLIDDEREGIAALDRRIERLKQAAIKMIESSPVLSRQWNHMKAAKGVGEASALAILAELCVLPATMKSSQVSRFAGLDVRVTQSGTSVRQPGRLNKAGNAYLRAALFMPAMSAVRHEPRAKAFYETLLSRGKKKIQALCAVMRKYLTGLWACLVTDSPFNAALLFSDEHQELHQTA